MEKILHGKNFILLYTHIIRYYNSSIIIIDLVSQITYVVCVLILYISGETYSWKSTPNDRFFEKLLMAILLLSEFLPEIYWEEIAEEILFLFWFDVWLGTRTLSSNPLQDENFVFIIQERNLYIIINLIQLMNNWLNKSNKASR